MILNRTPCRVGTPHQKWFDDKREALKYINKHNGFTHVYVSLYNGDVVDKVVYDFDPDDYPRWESLIYDVHKLKSRVDSEGWQYMIVFSGNGLHFYIKTQPRELQNPRAALHDVHTNYQEELDLNSDESVFGDIKQIIRVPNTYHPGAERYCIPLKPEEIYLPQEEIHEIAQEQRKKESFVTDGELYPIGKHDNLENYTSFNGGSRVPGNFNPAEIEPEGTLFPIYPCIANILQNWDDMEKSGHGMGFRRRFLVILHLKETGHSYDECVAILKKYMSNEEFRHCVYEESQVEQIYKRDDLLFPECSSLEQEIPCIHKPDEGEDCEKRDDLYY